MFLCRFSHSKNWYLSFKQGKQTHNVLKAWAGWLFSITAICAFNCWPSAQTNKIDENIANTCCIRLASLGEKST